MPHTLIGAAADSPCGLSRSRSALKCGLTTRTRRVRLDPLRVERGYVLDRRRRRAATWRTTLLLPGCRSPRVRVDVERIGEFEAAARGPSDESWYPATLEQERAADPAGLAVFVAEADGLVVSAGGCGSLLAPTSQPFGAARRCPRGAGVGSIARSFAAARSWQPSEDGATWRLTLRPTAERFSSGSTSGQSRASACLRFVRETESRGLAL